MHDTWDDELVRSLERELGGQYPYRVVSAWPQPDEDVFSMPRQFIGLFGWIALTGVAAAIGAMASIDASSFYAQLTLPGWAPPAGAFGPVWSLLYLLMAVAAWLVWREPGSTVRSRALVLYVMQLVLNALWSVLFFRERLGLWALADLLALWVLIVATAVGFWRVGGRAAATLLAPYLLWVSFAGMLNYSVWKLNRDLL